MPHARGVACGEQISSGRLEELQDGGRLKGRCARDVDDDRGAFERFGQPFAGNAVDTRLGRRCNRLGPCAARLDTTAEPISPLPPITIFFV